MPQQTIRIGALVPADRGAARYISQIIHHGFESFQITFGQTLGDVDLNRLSDEVRSVLADSGAVISCLGAYGNVLAHGEVGEKAQQDWARLIDAADRFGCHIVSGFAGRIADRPIDQCMDRFAQVFRPIAQRAADRGVRLAFENCSMGGDWRRGDHNIAHNPTAWEMMFNALPMDNIGLQWEPCHQMVQLIDPLSQLRQWTPKIFHLHGKDATIHWDRIRQVGVYNREWVVFHRTPGFGDTNWTDLISELRRGGYVGGIDIEGWHDPVYKDELEMTGQVHALQYLKRCRGGDIVDNPH